MGTRARFSQVTAGALAVFAAAAVVATWPLVLHPGRTIAGGLGDPLLNTTILAWDADRIRHLFRGLWDPPFLFPHRHTLAYSEHLLGIAIFTSPIAWISRNPILTYNVAYIGSYILAGFGMFLLARSLTGRVDAAILAALAFELTPYRLAQTTHVQVLMNGWMPIGLWALHNYFSTGARKWMLGFAAAFALVGLSNGYFFYFFAVPVLIVGSVEFAMTRLDRRQVLIDGAMAALLLIAIVGPIAWVYFRLQHDLGFVRTDEDLAGLSARAADYFRVSSGAWNWRGLLSVGGGERELFHGFVVLSFALLAAVVVRTRIVAMYVATAIAVVWLSMGPGGGPIYAWMFNHVPGFNGLRVPARFSAVAIVAFAVLAAVGFAWVLSRLPRAAGIAWAVAIGGIILLEGQHGVFVSTVPFAFERSWDRVTYEWLRTSPPGATLELNITQQDDFHPYTTTYQLESLRHRHPIVNGYSGFKSQLQEWLGGPASPLYEKGQLAETLDGLRAIGVRYVILHDATFPSQKDADALAQAIRSLPHEIAEEHRFGETWAWRLFDAAGVAQAFRPAPASEIDRRSLTVTVSHQRSRAELLTDGDLDTRWLSGDPQGGNEWIEVQLPRPTDVSGVSLVTAERSLYDYPRHLVIESVDADGKIATLFDGSVVSKLIEALAISERYPDITIPLPPNHATALRIRQTAESNRWWSVHELRLWRRDARETR
ncbi:MAG TPA: discoidin domain-containing protein [Vicinamibacterales bacterium]|nr:discoidin domain-containing protein [Vicinamibacterales bacterium]